MLYRFSVENFKSFKERSEISFIPHQDTVRHVVDAGSDVPVLRAAVIYGANASGKSNFIKAIDFAQDFILDNRKLQEGTNQAYRLDAEGVRTPSVFTFEIKVEEDLFQYGMAVSFKEAVVLEEWLFRLDERKEWVELFSRSYDKDSQKYELDFCLETGNSNKTRYEVYREDLSKESRKLVLTELAQKEMEADGFNEALGRVYQWFEKLMVIFPHSEYNLLGAAVKDLEAVNRLYKSYFKIFDIDIENINISPVPQSLVPIPQPVLTRIKVDLQRKEEANQIAMLNGNGRDFLVRLDDEGDLEFSEVKFIHKNDQYEVELNKGEESDGTQRLFDLIPLLGYVINEDRVVIVDEIDRSLHCLLTREIFEYFFRKSQVKRSQLICTTHDVLLLDLALLNKEEIWFVDKKDKKSVLYPLDKFKIGNAINIDKNYLLGRYDATPSFKNE